MPPNPGARLRRSRGSPASRVSTLARPDRDAVVMRVIGELDLLSTPQLRGQIDGCFAGGLPDAGDAPATRPVKALADVPRIIVLDLTGVTFLASAGLRFVLAASESASSHGQLLLVVVGDNRAVLRIMKITQLDQVLALFADLDEALG